MRIMGMSLPVRCGGVACGVWGVGLCWLERVAW